MKCNVNACDGLGNTALHIAISSRIDKLKKVQCLQESDECNPNIRNKDGYTPLHVACRRDNIEVAKMLVTDQRCDINIQDVNKNAPIHIACRLNILRPLLSWQYCNPNQQNEDGDTALHVACRGKNNKGASFWPKV